MMSILAAPLKSIENEWPYFHFDGQIDIPGLERALDLQHRIGSTPKRLSLDEVLDLRYQPAPSVDATLRLSA